MEGDEESKKLLERHRDVANLPATPPFFRVADRALSSDGMYLSRGGGKHQVKKRTKWTAPRCYEPRSEREGLEG